MCHAAEDPGWQAGREVNGATETSELRSGFAALGSFHTPASFSASPDERRGKRFEGEERNVSSLSTRKRNNAASSPILQIAAKV